MVNKSIKKKKNKYSELLKLDGNSKKKKLKMTEFQSKQISLELL